MKSLQREVQLRTAAGLRVTDITEEVAEAVRESGVHAGICTVYCTHTTCSVRVNEWERGFLEDFAVLLKRLVPTEHYYPHDERPMENTASGHAQRVGIENRRARCMSMLLGPPGESIPVGDGELSLGTWQRVLFLELDPERDPEHERHWLVQVEGV